MNADEWRACQFFFNGFYAHSGHDRFWRAYQVDFDIISESFDPCDIRLLHFYKTIIDIHEEIIGRRGLMGFGSISLAQLVEVLSLVACFEEAVEGYGFHEVIDDVEVISFERILFISGDQDEHTGGRESALDKLQTRQTGH